MIKISQLIQLFSINRKTSTNEIASSRHCYCGFDFFGLRVIQMMDIFGGWIRNFSHPQDKKTSHKFRIISHIFAQYHNFRIIFRRQIAYFAAPPPPPALFPLLAQKNSCPALSNTCTKKIGFFSGANFFFLMSGLKGGMRH